MELFEKFGINVSVLIAQTVNFLVVLAVLYAFAYKPLLKMLRSRTQTIEKSLKEAEEIHVRLKNAEAQQQKVIAAARKEADNILADATTRAQEQQKTFLSETEQKIQALTEKSKVQLQEQKDQMLRDVQSEVATMVVAVSEKILQEHLDPAKNRKLVEDHLKTLSNTRS